VRTASVGQTGDSPSSRLETNPFSGSWKRCKGTERGSPRPP